jgi:hypothetical protein
MHTSTEAQTELILGTPGRDRYRIVGDLVDVTKPAAQLLAARISAKTRTDGEPVCSVPGLGLAYGDVGQRHGLIP